MKQLALLIAALLTILMLGPLLIALIVAGIVSPAAISTMVCEEEPPVAAAGEWRPPFQAALQGHVAVRAPLPSHI
jgi:hypothetical protein